MANLKRRTWLIVLGANVVFWCVLSFYRTGDAAPGPASEPFANAVQQRAEMIQHLRELKDLVREQNELLRTGKAQVRIVLPDQP
jgi:hypothetical protein